MATTTLHMLPTATTVRTGVGAIVADNATINDTNYPLATFGFNPDCRAGHIVVAWSGSGTIGATDWLDLQILLRDGIAGVWREGLTQHGVAQNELVAFPVNGASMVCIRVAAASCAAGTGLVITAAQSDNLR